jgi:hypothetical protein
MLERLLFQYRQSNPSARYPERESSLDRTEEIAFAEFDTILPQ